MSLATCIIPAAGEGVRARPQTEAIPKGMLRVAGKPVLHHTITLVRDQLGIESFILVTGRLGQVISDYFQDGHWLGVKIRYIENKAVDRGLPWSILLAKEFVDDYFLVLLGDEFYKDSNHFRLRELSFSGTLATFGVLRSSDHSRIRKNYAVTLAGGQAVRLVEKPEEVNTDLMGTGTFVFSPQIFTEIDKGYGRCGRSLDLITLLDRLCVAGHRIEAFELEGEYVNINDLEALAKANALEKGKKKN